MAKSKLSGCLFAVIGGPIFLFILIGLAFQSAKNAEQEHEKKVQAARKQEMERIEKLPPEKKKVEIARVAARDKKAEREQILKQQFSSWDGSHRLFVKMVKATMNDPKSFEHVDTKYWIIGDNVIKVSMTYRGKNSFNATVTETQAYYFTVNGDQIGANPTQAQLDTFKSPKEIAEKQEREKEIAQMRENVARLQEEADRQKKEEKQRGIIESKASEALKLIKKHFIGKKDEAAKEKLQGIVEKYPNTKSAEEASELLKTLGN